MATDNGIKSYWTPSPNDKKPWIMLDTERCIKVENVNIKLASESEVKDYKVETSLDGRNGKSLMENP